MARINNLTNFLTDVASAIKTKTGDSSLIPASQFDTKIADINTGNLSDEEYAEANTDLDDILEGSTPTKIYPPDWSEIGYEDTPDSVLDSFNYSKNIKDNWNSEITSMNSKYSGNTDIVFMPLVDTSNVNKMNYTFMNCTLLSSVALLDTSRVTEMQRLFYNCAGLISFPSFDLKNVTNINSICSGCNNLKNVPILNFEKVTNMSNAFSYCYDLTNDSLNNIMASCLTAISYTGTKTLKYIGLTSEQATTCQSLSNYQAFLDAGWTTGY